MGLGANPNQQPLSAKPARKADISRLFLALILLIEGGNVRARSRTTTAAIFIVRSPTKRRYTIVAAVRATWHPVPALPRSRLIRHLSLP